MTSKIKGDKLKEFYEQTMVCTSCGYCKSVCPTFNCTLWDSNSARSKIMLAYGLLKDEIRPDDSVVQSIYECTTCADCMRRCPSKVETLKIIMATRNELAQLNLIPKNTKLALDNIKESNNPLGESIEKRIDFVPDEAKKRIGKGAEVLLYLGCITSLQDMKMANSIFEIMERSGINYTLLGNEEPCCGFLNYLVGYEIKPFGEKMNKAIDTLHPKPKTIVTPCPGCFRSLSNIYEKEDINFDFNIKHITEYFNELLEKGHLVVNKKLKGKVLYHDPCDLGRHCDIFDPPRKLLSHFTKVHEFKYKRDEAHCCGGGGGLQSTNYEITSDIAKARVREALELEADMIVTACPACKSTLSNAAVDIKKETGKKIKVKDIVEIVSRNTVGKDSIQ
jgi:glycolate oxidase